MDEPAELLAAAREAAARRDWPRALDLFSTVMGAAPLEAEDLEALSDAAWWVGDVDTSLTVGEAAFQLHLQAGAPRQAAMVALDTAVSLFLRGDDAQGSGWISRAQRLLADLPEGPEHGYVRYVLEVEGALDGPDLPAVADAARDVQRVGREHDDPNLVAIGVVGEARALIRRGEVTRGLRHLDEAMVAVVSGDLDPEWAGNVYCHLMAACHELADVQRAAEWTDATSTWLSEQSSAAMFTGICRVHRSQVLQVAGDWDGAEQAAARVVEDLADLHVASVAEAHYQLGEVRRLRGDLEAADEAYARARRLGRDPQPGMALLRLAQGRTDDAAAAVRTALHVVSGDRLARARLCQAQVEIALAAGDLGTAQRACEELEAAAATYGTSGLEAAALHWRGAVALAGGHPEQALPALRAACRRWHAGEAPYEAARACVLLGRSYRALDDPGAAESELASAREAFERLGADADVAVVDGLRGARTLPGGLTAREAEVLELVSSGRTNRQVADVLTLSEKTIARHLSNIFAKLGVSSRTEAAAFAFKHGLADTERG